MRDRNRTGQQQTTLVNREVMMYSVGVVRWSYNAILSVLEFLEICSQMIFICSLNWDNGDHFACVKTNAILDRN